MGARKGVGVGVPWAAPGSEADDPLLLDEVNSIETDDELGAAILTADNLWGQVIPSGSRNSVEWDGIHCWRAAKTLEGSSSPKGLP